VEQHPRRQSSSSADRFPITSLYSTSFKRILIVWVSAL
jgi:hypothetical protein